MEVHSYFRHVGRFVRLLPEPRPRPSDPEHPVILNRRSLLLSLGLTLPIAAEAATSAHKKTQPHHTTKTASSKSHGKTHAHPAKPTQS